MAQEKYRCTRRCWIEGRQIEPGEEFQGDEIPKGNLKNGLDIGLFVKAGESGKDTPKDQQPEKKDQK